MRAEKKLIVVILWHFLLQGTQPISDKRGPYDEVWKHLDDCGKEDALLKVHVRSRKIARATLLVEGRFTVMNVSVNDDIKMKGQIQKLTPSGWKQNYLVIDFGDKGVCSISKEHIEPQEYKDIFSKIHSASAVNDNQTEEWTDICPLEPGDYVVNGVKYDLLNPKPMPGIPQVFFYGEYRVFLTMFSKDFSRELACIAIYFDLVPKRKRKNNG